MIWNLEKSGCPLYPPPPNYLNRLEGRFINLLEYIWNGKFFVQMKIGTVVDVNQNNLEITFMKKYLEIYWKTWKSHGILSVWKSGNPAAYNECIFYESNNSL